MAELVMLPTPRTRPRPQSHRLGAGVAALAGRLGRLLAAAPATELGVRDAATFLQGMAEGAPHPSPGTQVAAFVDPIDSLVDRLRLTPTERDLILLAGMAEEHEGYASVLRSLHPRGEPRPTSGLAAQLLCESGADRYSLRETLELGAAVRSGALEVVGDGPFFERGLLLAESLWPALQGIDAWPRRLRVITAPPILAGLQEWLASPGAASGREALRRGDPDLILVSADSERTAFERALALAEDAGIAAVGLDVTGEAGEEPARLAGLHALARGLVPVLRVAAADGHSGGRIPDLRWYPGPVIACAKPGATIPDGRTVLPVPIEPLSPRARSRMWRELLPELAGAAPHLAARYPVEPAAARDIAADVRGRVALQGGTAGLADVADVARIRSSVALVPGVKLARPTARWEQLVLPEDRLLQLRQALDRLVHQDRVIDDWGFLDSRPGARGVRLLFCGPPGTGKTFGAEVMAHALDADLLVVDISRVVSKWIGETEKNLAAAFDAAEQTRAVLLFDEADALFGKRTEVSDAHDRYANLETAYLLSRLERFDGLTILTTNLRQNIDPAFTRRLEFIVEFDEPSHDERVALWRGHLPLQAPLDDDVDFAELAGLYPLVGALIRNAAVAAGFLAAAEDSAITRSHLVRAIYREYEKSGRVFPGAPAGLNLR